MQKKAKEDTVIEETKVPLNKKSTNSKVKTAKKSSKKNISKTSKNKSDGKKITPKKVATKAVKKPKVEVLEYYDLPYRYNQTTVKILAQTPNTLFVYWDISDKDISTFKEKYGDNFFETTKPILKIHNITMNYYFEIDINDFANCWYLTVNDSKCNYEIELDRKSITSSNTDLIYISSSNKIESPNDHILFEKIPNNIKFKNVKNSNYSFKKLETIPFAKNVEKIFNITELYDLLYTDKKLINSSNPSSKI